MASSSGVLPSRDLRDMLDVVRAEPDSEVPDGMPFGVLAGLQRLIPCDLVNFCDLDVSNEKTFVDQYFPEAGFTFGFDDALERHWWASFWQNRFCSHSEQSGDRVSVHRLSDFYSRREQREVLGYHEFFADVQHEVMVCLPTASGRTRRILFCRGTGTRDFTERDRLVLTLLRPHLHAVWQRAERTRQGIPQLTPREREVLGLAAEGRPNGEIARMLVVSTATVRKHLEHVFDKLGVRSRTAAAAVAFPRVEDSDVKLTRYPPSGAVSPAREAS